MVGGSGWVGVLLVNVSGGIEGNLLFYVREWRRGVLEEVRGVVLESVVG